MVSEMESVKNVTNSVNNFNSNPSPQPQHSPQSVGVEFVRQYYTMLNRAPQLLFRFYSEDSTFSRCNGEPIKGQKHINNKIMALNFKNCHTKIRQVDSVETIGNGVVIQVIGELSNNGLPLRRFLQTFVLTPQSPNKYYVRNDIFRYQDEIYLEENDEQIEKGDIEPKIENEIKVDNLEPVETNEKDYSYQSNGRLVGTLTNPIAEQNVPAVEENVIDHEEPEPVEENSIENNTDLVDVSPAKEQVDDVEEEEEEEVESVSESVTNANHLSNEPKTYANMVSKSFQGVGPNINLSSAKPTVNTFTPAPVVSTTSDVIAANVAENPVAQPIVNNTNNKNAGFANQRERFVKKGNFNKRNESRENVKNNEEEVIENVDGDAGDQLSGAPKTKVFPDDHQLFIGNLLPNFCEDELRNIFTRYGKITDVRINRQSHKTNSNKANRNYGFITFENPDVVDQIIAQKPIYHGNHRYNVEKKQGKSNYDRNRNSNQPNNGNSPRNGAQPSVVPNPAQARHMQMNSAGGGGGQGGNPGPRPRPGHNYNLANSTGNRNFASGQNFANRNSSFNHQQQPQQQQPQQNR